MNPPIRKVAIACLLLFSALLINANWLQAKNADTLRHKPGNARQITERLERERGSIAVAGGQAVASSVPVDDEYKFQRQYPAPTLYSNIIGYYGLYTSAGLERSQNDFLSGEDQRLFVSKVSDLVTGREQRGGSIVTTLVPQIQQVATTALGNRKGAVVALDPKTGEILAMVTNPTYDPTPLASHNETTASKAAQALNTDPDKPLLNRATQETYPPGSTFKVIAAAAALAAGHHLEERIAAPDQLQLPQSKTVLPNFAGERCGDGQTDTLIHALTISCNTAFAKLGIDLGHDALRAQAEAFGFNATVPDFPLAQVASVYPTASLDGAQTAQSAIGQFDDKVTPLQMAQVAAAIGNNGVMMRPYLVAELLGPDLKAISRTEPEVYKRPVSAEVAANLNTMMQSVVTSGTGTKAQIPGVAVAGKTGTAEHGDNEPPHAWFIGFAPAVNPTVAIAVIVENGGGELSTGGAVAAPVAQQVMKAALGIRR
ncbi:MULTISPECIES: penicillin-binding protein 2 [unclassified Frankia]|uniref:peptidoglycan D,D-transpeptidase FtsI family protein n=1 Tax=unclassified Frankia TaxID=2632575 RepID=UPI001EF6C7BB|nr:MULTISPECIES: penicillin-binding protein 2 [unclassified Frankia]